MCFRAASATVTDRAPKTLWQVHSPIHSRSQTFDSLGNKIAVLPSDDKNQITSDGAERLIVLLPRPHDNFLPVHFLCCIALCERPQSEGGQDSSAMMVVIFYGEKVVTFWLHFQFYIPTPHIWSVPQNNDKRSWLKASTLRDSHTSSAVCDGIHVDKLKWTFPACNPTWSKGGNARLKWVKMLLLLLLQISANNVILAR